jgi:hypothetical protein
MYTPGKLLSGLLATGAAVSLVIVTQQTRSDAVPELTERPRVASIAGGASGRVAHVRRASSSDEAEAPSFSLPHRPSSKPTALAPVPAEDNDATAPSGTEGSTANTVAVAPEPSWGPLSTINRLLEAVGMGGSVPATADPGTSTAERVTAPSSPNGVRNISFSDTAAGACQSGAETFGLNSVREIHVCVSWPVVTGTHELDVTFVSPDGNAYQAMRVPFVTPDAVELDSVPPDVQRATLGSRGEARVVMALPVAGTHISRYKLVGVWTVRASVDGQAPDVDRFTLFPPQ